MKPDIWVYDLPRGTLTRLTFQGFNLGPVWTPDGKRVTFVNVDAGKNSLAWVLADGSGPPETLAVVEGQPTSWSPDGKLLAFDGGPRGQNDIMLLPRPDGPPAGPTGRPAARPFLKTQHDEQTAMFSPDGRWIAYLSRESGDSQVYVRPAAAGPGGASGGRWQVSTGGGFSPRWARGGGIWYRDPDLLPHHVGMLAPVQRSLETQGAQSPNELFPGDRPKLSLAKLS